MPPPATQVQVTYFCVTNRHACQGAGTLALPKHTNDFDTDTDWEWLPNQILITIN
jgi:hypothetical protein